MCQEVKPWVSPIVANIYMDDVENSFQGMTPTHWISYIDDTWVKIKIQEVQILDHINAIHTREDTRLESWTVQFSKGLMGG